MAAQQIRRGTEARLFKEHLINVNKAVGKTDNKAPKLPIKAYVKDASFYGDLFKLRQIERQNRELLKQINIIYRTKGKVDCQVEGYTRKKTMFKIEQAALDREKKVTADFLKSLEPQFVKSIYNQDDMVKDWKRMLKVKKHKARYPEFYDKKTNLSWSLCPKNVKGNPKARKVCYLDLKIGSLPRTVRLDIEVYCDIVPGTAENFISLCSGSVSNLSYKDSVFHRIVPGLLCIGGDVINHSGTGGMSIYGASFPDENFTLQHNGPGVLAMYRTMPDCNHSQFLITFKTLTTLNGKYVVFGRVKSNLSSLHLIESCGTKGGKPCERVTVVNCGLYK